MNCSQFKAILIAMAIALQQGQIELPAFPRKNVSMGVVLVTSDEKRILHRAALFIADGDVEEC